MNARETLPHVPTRDIRRIRSDDRFHSTDGDCPADTPEVGLPYFGQACDNPAEAWDDEYGQWWPATCYFNGSQFETFHTPRRRLVPAQQNFHTLYPMSAGGVQVLMGDGAVRNVTTSVSMPAWSAAVTPDGGETLGPDS